MKIAVIDDDLTVRKMVRRLLEGNGYEVVEASNGLQGLDLIRSEFPSLIISDINMPKMNGDELFRELKNSDFELQIIPFILVSGNFDDERKIQYLNEGVYAFIEKPFKIKMLDAHVRSCKIIFERYSNVISLNTKKEPFKSMGNAFDKIDKGDNDRVVSSNETLRVIRFCLEDLEKRRVMVDPMKAEMLTWWLVFAVAESEFSGVPLYVSDLYVSAPSAKTTINTRILSLESNGIFEKKVSEDDHRRLKVQLTDSFKLIFKDYINAFITSFF